MEHQKTTEIFKALGDEIRLGIVRKLVSENDAVASCDIISSCASRTNLSQPAMSHHFNKLVAAGVLSEQKCGTQKKYQLETDYLLSLGIDVSKL